MEINNKSVEEFYETINEEERLKRQNVNKIELITTTHYLEKVIKPNSKILDACVGAGIYSFYFAEKGHQVYSRDLVEKNVECIKNNELNSKKIKEIFVGSILDLSRYEDESFDFIKKLGIP